jgi:ketosteroid isomerase-like protein
MSEQKNLETITRVLDAINRNDIDAAREAAHPDIRYIIRGNSAVGGTYRGIEAIARALRRLLELTAGTLATKPEMVMARGDDVMMYLKVSATRPDGRRYQSHNAYIYRFKDGKLIEGQTIPVDQDQFAAFLSG